MSLEEFYLMIEEKNQKLLYYLSCFIFFLMPMGTSPVLIIGGILFLVWCLSGEFIRSRDKYLRWGLLLPVIVIIILVWTGLFWSYDPSGLGIKYAEKTHYWIFVLLIASVAFSERPVENLIKALLYGLVINALIGFGQFFDFIPERAEWGYHTGLHGGYNTLSGLVILGVLSASYFFRVSSSRKGKGLYGVFMLICFLHLMILPGRGGYVTFIILSPIVLFNVFINKNKIIVFSAYIFILAILFSSPIVRHRVDHAITEYQAQMAEGGDIATGEKYSKYIDRIYMWRWAFKLFLQHPIIGVGTGGYSKATVSAGGDTEVAHPHNNILHIAASYGILGLIVFGWLFWVLLKEGWRSRQGTAGFFVLVSTLVLFVGGLTDTTILDAGGGIQLAITLGLLFHLNPNKSLLMPENSVSE